MRILDQGRALLPHELLRKCCFEIDRSKNQLFDPWAVSLSILRATFPLPHLNLLILSMGLTFAEWGKTKHGGACCFVRET